MMGLIKKRAKEDYFIQAKDWAHDKYGQVLQSKNRYQVAFLAAMVLNMFTVIALVLLSSIQTLIPLVIHHYENGITTVAPLTTTALPINQAQVESDIIRYVINRESYDVSSYKYQYDLVRLLSDDKVGKQYATEQDKQTKDSPINHLSTTHYREVHVYSINFLDNLLFNDKEASTKHHNLAEVVFSLRDVDKLTGLSEEHHYNALISWEYKAPSALAKLGRLSCHTF